MSVGVTYDERMSRGGVAGAGEGVELDRSDSSVMKYDSVAESEWDEGEEYARRLMLLLLMVGLPGGGTRMCFRKKNMAHGGGRDKMDAWVRFRLG